MDGHKSLFPGGVSDTEYMVRIGIFEEQMEFARNDVTKDGIIPFCNELDKCYRCLEVAYRAGNQLTIQPDFLEVIATSKERKR